MIVKRDTCMKTPCMRSVHLGQSPCHHILGSSPFGGVLGVAIPMMVGSLRMCTLLAAAWLSMGVYVQMYESSQGLGDVVVTSASGKVNLSISDVLTKSMDSVLGTMVQLTPPPRGGGGYQQHPTSEPPPGHTHM